MTTQSSVSARVRRTREIFDILMKLEAMIEEEIEFDFFLYHSYEQKQLSSQCNYIRDTY